MTPRLLAALVSVSLSLGACSREIAPRGGVESNFADGRSVPVFGGYEVTLPSTYEVRSGQGDDTAFFEVRRRDEEVVFRLELGPGTPAGRARFSEIPDAYLFSKRTEFETPAGLAGAYFYDVNEARTLRQVSGTVIFAAASGDGYEQVFNAEHSRESFEEVLQILRTLRHD